MDEKKFILDSNIRISCIITDTLDDFIRSIVENDIQIYADKQLIKEISDVLSRPKFKKYLRLPVSRFMEVIELAITLTETQPFRSKLPDPKDNFLIALAITSGVKKIVIGDKLFLSMKTYEGIEFLSFSDLRTLVKSE